MGMELRTLKNNLTGMPEALQILLAAHLTATLAAAEEAAKAIVPVDEGELQASISHELTGPLTGQLTAGTDHADAIEFGTHNTPAQSFLRPSIDTIQDGFLDGIGSAVEKAANR